MKRKFDIWYTIWSIAPISRIWDVELKTYLLIDEKTEEWLQDIEATTLRTWFE